MDNTSTELQRLIMAENLAPPKTPPEKNPYYKRRGKPDNRDTCDACGYGDSGHLLCCDNCLVSLHWDCHDPPFEDEDKIPRRWFCKSCTYDKKKKTELEAMDKEEVELKLEEPEELSETLDNQADSGSLYKVFEQLTEACSRINPSQFKLPLSYPCYERQFPGVMKAPWKKAKPKPLRAEIENARILRVALCQYCDKSSRLGAMIKCDFCPLFFHLHCLNPPMTNAPAAVWACPMHPEISLESKFLKTSALSERIKIWDETSHSFDPAVVQLNFIKRINTSKRRATESIESKRSPIKIPHMVQGKYFINTSNVRASPTMISQYELEPASGIQGLEPTQPKLLHSELDKASDGKGKDDHAESDKVSGGKKNDANEASGLSIAQQNPSLQTILSNGIGSGGLDMLANAATLKAQENVFDVYLKDLHPNMIRALAFQKLMELQALHGPRLPVVALDEIEARNLTSQAKLSDHTSAAQKKELLPTLKVVSLNKGVQLQFMGTTCLIGTGSDAYINLSKFGTCSVVSDRHAMIYYDKISSRWELINYSPHGTFVNNELFGCTTNRVEPIPSQKQAETLHDFKEIINKRRQVIVEPNQKTLTFNTSNNANPGVSCQCQNPKTKKQTENVYEGGVLVQSGDILGFGCCQFIVTGISFTEKILLKK